MKFPLIISVFILFQLAASANAQPGRIYTEPDPAAKGGIEGNVGSVELTCAIAVDNERKAVFLAELGGGGKTFRFEHLPIAKYDLALVAKNGAIFEGLSLGAENSPSSFSETSLQNLKTRIAAADSFFDRHIIHRRGLDGSKMLVFVERIRDREIFKQSGEVLEANLRRLEIVELMQAADDWQMAGTRLLYREEEPRRQNPPFFKHAFIRELGGIRVVDSAKQLGMIALPKN